MVLLVAGCLAAAYGVPRGTLYLIDACGDRDADGLADTAETGTGVFVNPQNTGTSASAWDSDGDGVSDYDEVFRYRTDPNAADTQAPLLCMTADGGNGSLWIP